VKKQLLDPGRRAKLERHRDWARRMVTLVNDVLATFTAETELPPLPLPSDVNGWLATRWQARQVWEKAEQELGTVEQGAAE